MKTFKGDFLHIVQLLKDKKHFAFSRFSDGELMVIKNQLIVISQNMAVVHGQAHGGFWGPEEHKVFDPNTQQDFRKKLIECFEHKQENYYKGICCRCCVGEEWFAWQFDNHLSRDEAHLTWSNVFINSNYPMFIEQALPAMKDHKVVYVCNEIADLSKFPLNLVKDFRVGNNCHIRNVGLVEEMKTWVRENNIKDHLFLFSAASLSNILIYELYKEFPDNVYLDIGSTLNPLLGMNGWMGSRGYLRGYWLNQHDEYSRKECIW
jgi:hypothetical protein